VDERVYRAGIIGTARVGSWYDDLLQATPELIPSSHAGCYAAHPKTELVAGCDLNADRLQAFGAKWGIAALHTDYQEMLAKERLDIVSITTSWGHDHAAIAPVVAESGVKAIFCEKPIATSMAEADRIVRAVQEHGVTFVCAYLRRWNPRYQAIRAALTAGVIGRVVSITAMTASSLMHSGSHYTDLMAFLTGDPRPVWAWGTVEPVDATTASRTARVDPPASGCFEMDTGVRFILDGVSPGPLTLVISGTQGKLVVLNDARTVQVWKAVPGGAERWLEHVPFAVPAIERSPVLLALEDLIAAMEARREPTCSERQAAQAMEMCLALHLSHRAGGSRVPVPIEDRALSVDTP
jgi:predicted dehydrogenase